VLHTFFDAFDTDERYNGTKRLLPCDAHVTRHFIDQNGPYEIPFSLILLKKRKAESSASTASPVASFV
jgi:hypothetical protein